eukprot:CAMPEP_0206200834 /NCGR_PEP_ID=MMETSP0166-20121206/11140_1 /ASSEMBLY_ACC=CAM_ASM_000260 /TAXON_ID=95228 /ORGANISM="Vannella robusta, Strain DIVA3 518/3/11/1/6" /LENGTH=753 /DNA_ID=CAMNT_0053619297 /DNA_START=317 /DNA_END=2574 /DNA_ORIENTATION=-
MEIDLSVPDSALEKRIASGISPYDIPTHYQKPGLQNISNGTNPGSEFSNDSMDTSDGYKSYSRGLKANVTTTRIRTTITETSPYFSAPPKFFSRATASALPSLLYSLAPKKSPIDDLPDRDWNKEFNEVLESPLLERAEKLRKLEKEFVEVASIIGKIIISEKNVHPSQKTVKAISVDSGIAGGEKYQVKGIFFKFAVDKADLYGSDEHAMKVACHELKGHTALVSCGMVHGLKLGLMTVIDYQGSRLTAVSVLPISRDTLVYGSSDAGRVVCSSLEAMNDIMRQCGKVLNLKGHLAGVGEEKKFIYGPCDLEGHLGHDGRLYAIDLARLFPPETPKESIRGGFLYRLLRPELVRQFHKPLSSDAFTMFGAHDSDKHDAEVRQATEFLHSHVVPEFASSLANEDHHISIDDILVKMHRAGINIRFLGEVRSLVTNLSQRKTILTEICARVFKNEIRKKLRDSKSTQPTAYARLCINFFNTIFGDKPISKTFWQAIKKPMLQRFVQALSANELQRDFDVRKHVHMEMLFSRLQNAAARYEDLPLSLAHFKEFVVKAKQMYTVPRIEADTAAELARTTKDISEAKRLLSLARENYNSVLELKPDDHVVLSNLGMVIAESAMLEDGEEREDLFHLANEKFEASLLLHGDDPHTLVMWSDVLVNQMILLGEDSESGNTKLLDRALSMSLKAESFVSGIGSLTIARASALQGREKQVQKCLRHAASTNNLPGVEALMHDPAFARVKNTTWFSSFLEAP